MKLLHRLVLTIPVSHTSTRSTGSSVRPVINFPRRIGNSFAKRAMPSRIFLSFQIISHASTAIAGNSSREKGPRHGSVRIATSKQARGTLRVFPFPVLASSSLDQRKGEILFLSSRSYFQKTNMRTVNCHEPIALVSLVTTRKANLPRCRRAAAVVISWRRCRNHRVNDVFR